MTAVVTPPPTPAAPAVPAVAAWRDNSVRLLYARNISYEDVADDMGSWSIELPGAAAAAAERASLTPGTLVAFRELGNSTPAFVGVVEDIVQRSVAVGEERAQSWTFSGRSVLSELDRALVYPPKGLIDWAAGHGLDGLRVALRPVPETRYWNYASVGLNRSSWTSAVQIFQAGQNPGLWPPDGYVGCPVPWPAPNAWWIAPRAISGGAHPAGDWYVAATVTTSGAFTYDMHAACGVGDEMWLWWDGDLVLHTEPQNALKPHEVNITANDGTHLVVARIRHADDSAGQITGFLFSLFRNYPFGGGYETGPIAVSNSSWICSDVDQPTPCFRLNEIAAQLIDEPQTRDTLPGWSKGWSGSNDSAGQIFPKVPEFSTPVGNRVSDAAKALCEGWIEQAAPAGRTWRIWNHKGATLEGGGTAAGRGTASGVTITPGQNVSELTHHTTAAEASSVLTRWAGGYLEVTDEDDENPRREAFLSVPDIEDGPIALYYTAFSREPLKDPAESIDTLTHTLTSGTQYRVGDTITAPTKTGSMGTWRVQSRMVSTDADGNGRVTSSLGTPRDDLETRNDRWRRKVLGTLDGRSETARPSSPWINRSQIPSPRKLRFSTGGGGVVLVGDRGTPIRPDDILLILGMEIASDIAGASGPTTVRLELNGDPVGSTVTAASGWGWGRTVFSAPFVARTTDWLNVEATAAGGHAGVTVEVVAMVLQ